jgi:outer membrane protein assembly factor BamB
VSAMRTVRMRWALVAAFTSALLLVGPGTAGQALELSGPGSVRWSSPYPGNPESAAADPTGELVFVSGSSLVAYDARTGAQRWDNGVDANGPMAVSPDGQVVFVSTSPGGDSPD